MKRWIGVTAVGALVMALALPSFAFEASNKPVTRGPIVHDGSTYSGRDCGSDSASFGGEVVARYKTCSFFFRFNPANETNPDRDYGVLWLQSHVNPTNGWCASKVTTKLELSLGSGRRVDKATERTSRPSSPKTIRQRLKVTANGMTTTPGVVRKSFKVFRHVWSSDYLRAKDTLKLFWDGATRRTVGSAGGVAISWPAAGGPPPLTARIQPVMQQSC